MVRIDRLLCFLRVVRTRGRAQALVAGGHLRLNGLRVTRPSQKVAAGDVLTVPHGRSVRVIELLALPERRGSPSEAREHYRELDVTRQSAIAAQQEPEAERGQQQ